VQNNLHENGGGGYCSNQHDHNNSLGDDEISNNGTEQGDDFSASEDNDDDFSIDSISSNHINNTCTSDNHELVQIIEASFEFVDGRLQHRCRSKTHTSAPSQFSLLLGQQSGKLALHEFHS
jgi:hypothetical protein